MSTPKKKAMVFADSDDEEIPARVESKKRKRSDDGPTDDSDALPTHQAKLPKPTPPKAKSEGKSPKAKGTGTGRTTKSGTSSTSKTKPSALFTDQSAAPHPNYNQDIGDILLQLGETERNAGQKYKYVAYATAANSLRLHPHRIQSGEEAKKLPGIGKKIAKKIDEILATGQLQRLENDLHNPELVAVNMVSKVVGIGPVLAHKLVKDSGVRTMEDLVKIKDTLPHVAQVGLKYFADLEKKIPRAEVALHEKLLLETAAAVDPELVVQVVGSYRRGLAASSDVDLLLMHPRYTLKDKDNKKSFASFDKFVTALTEKGYLLDTIAHGASKVMGVCRLPSVDTEEEKKAEGEAEEEPKEGQEAVGGFLVRRLDLKLFPVESFWAALLHFTGSGEHNRQLRIRAQDKNYKLSEYGLFPMGASGTPGDPLPLDGEEDIFAILEVPWREPSQRSI